MNPLSSQSQASLQKLSEALKQVTPSVNEQLLTSESVTTRVEQIAKELEEGLSNAPYDEEGYLLALRDNNGELLRELDQLVSGSKDRIDSGKDALSQLTKDSAVIERRSENLTYEVHNMSAGLSSNLLNLSSQLEQFNTVLTEINRLQYKQREQEDKRNKILQDLMTDLQRQFDAYGEGFSQAVGKRPQKPRQKKPSASTIAQEARFLAEAQVRRDLLNQQRQQQLNQCRIVFLVALTLLSLGVLFVFAGIIGTYFFNLTAGAITATSGAVVDVISAVVFRFNKQENDRLDAITRELSVLDRVTMAMQYISHISDGEKKDQAILDLTKQLYTIQPQQ